MQRDRRHDSVMASSVVAFHGSLGNAAILARDMGDPAWVDLYHEGHDVDAARNICSAFESVVLVGYSMGGSVMGHLSHVLGNIAAVVLYESPLLGIDRPAGTFPVLWIRNDYRWTNQREIEFAETRAAWGESHHVDEMIGQGRHIRFVWGCPVIGHAWDQQLNPAIRDWIKHHSN